MIRYDKIISIVLNDDQGGHMAKLTDSLWWFEPAGVFRARLTPSAHLAHIKRFLSQNNQIIVISP